MYEINNKIVYLVEFCIGFVDEKFLYKCFFNFCVLWIYVFLYRICMVFNIFYCFVVRNMFMMFF